MSSNSHQPLINQPLTAKQQRFVEEYLVDHNGTQAAIRAGYSAKCAATVAKENIRKPHIAAALKKGRKALCEKTGHSAEQTIDAIAAIANDEENHTGYRLKAYELLGKTQGIFVEKREVKHSGSISDGDPGLQATMDLLEELADARDPAPLSESLSD